MTPETLMGRVRQLTAERPPLPGRGHTAERHQRLFEIGLEDLSVARLIEAHWDALAVLAEAGSKPISNAVYGVWAAEAPDMVVRLDDGVLSGMKPFCSGAGLVDRALVTVKEPAGRLVDVDLKAPTGTIRIDDSSWKTKAFGSTKTARVEFDSISISNSQIIGKADFYLRRPGFWHGACGPAACWAGGAAALVSWATQQKRNDAHTMAHLGAMNAVVWSMESALRQAGAEIDLNPDDLTGAHVRALTVRHVVEQGCSEIMHRLARAYGPHPLAFNESVSNRIQELNLYVRQSHAERDLEVLGRLLHESQ